MESKLNKQAIIDGYEDYLKEVNDEPCEISLAEYMTGIFYAIEDTYDLDLVNEAEEELRDKYDLHGDITDEIDEQELYLEESKTLLQEKEAKIQENINTMKINGVEHDIYDVKLKDERGNIFVTSYPILPEERETAEQVIQSAYEPYKVISFKPQDTAQFGLKTPRLDVSEM